VALPSKVAVQEEKAYLGNTRRHCQVARDHGTLDVMCRRTSNGTTDAVEFQGFLNHNENGVESLVTLRVHYITNVVVNDTASAQDMHVKLISVLEYIPASATSIGYVSGDTVKQEWKPEWTSWGGNKGNGYFEFQATANTTSGTLIVRAYIASNDTNVGANNVALDANHVKFDFEIDNFPYMASSGSYLALKTRIGTLDTDVTMNNGDVSGSYTFTRSTSALQAAFTFTDYVNVSSGTASIVHTAASPYDYFAVNSNSQASFILWDPTIGFEAASTGSGASTASFSVAAFFAALLAVWYSFE